MLRSPHPTERRLASVPLLDGLRARDLRQLAPYVESATARAGQALVDGERVASVGPDEIVGERTLLGERRANATVTAAVDSEVLVLDHRALLVTATEHPEIADRLQGVVATRAAA
jgi:CRP-like cAMP-binding protein